MFVENKVYTKHKVECFLFFMYEYVSYSKNINNFSSNDFNSLNISNFNSVYGNFTVPQKKMIKIVHFSILVYEFLEFTRI